MKGEKNNGDDIEVSFGRNQNDNHPIALGYFKPTRNGEDEFVEYE